MSKEQTVYLAENISTLKSALGYKTDEELSRKYMPEKTASQSRNCFNHYMRGKARPKLELIKEMADDLGVTVDDFVFSKLEIKVTAKPIQKAEICNPCLAYK